MSDDTDLRFRLFGRDVSASRALRGVGREADKTDRKLSTLKTGLIGFGGAAGLGALPGTINVLAGALAASLGALATLPAVAAAGGVAFGSLKIATLGFSDALEQVRDSEKFAEQLKYLAPAAREAAIGIRTLLPEIDNLRLNVQQNLFENFIKDIKPLTSTYLPVLREGLSAIAAEAGRGGGGLARFLGKPEQVEKISGFLGQTATAAGILGKALEPALDALLTLTTTGGQFLPVFAKALGDAATNLAGFLDESAASGDLAGFMRDGIAAVGGLLGALRDVRKLVTGLFGPAIKGGGLDAFSSLLGAIQAQVNSPEFQAGLTALFAALNNIGAGIASSLPSLASALASLVPTIVNFANAVAFLGPTYLQSVFVLIEALAPVLSTLSIAFAVTAFAATEFSRAFLLMDQVIVSGTLALLQAASAIPGVGQVLGGLTRAFADAAKNVVNLRNGLPSTQQGLVLVAQAAGAARGQLASLPSKISIGIEYSVSISGPAGILGAGKFGGPGQGLGVLAPPGGNITVGKKVTGGPSYDAGLGVGKGFGSGVGKGIEKTKDYTNNKLVKAAKSLAVKLKSAMEKLASIVKARAAYIKQIRDALVSATSITGFEKDENRRGNPGAGYYTKYLANRLKALRKYAANIAKLRKFGLNKTTLQQILDAGLEGGADDAAALAGGGKKAIGEVNKTQKAIGKVAGGLATGVGNQFFKAGIAAARGLVKGLKSARTALLKVARDLAKGLRDAIRKELKIKSPSRALAEDGRFAGMGFLNGVNSMRPAINKSLSGLSRPGTTFRGAPVGGGKPVEYHYHVHAGVIEDSAGVIRKLDGMARTAQARGYRPQTLALQGKR